MKYIREEGKIYFAKNNTENGYSYIFMSNAINGYSAYIAINESSYSFTKSNSGSTYNWDGYFTVREATELERQWFELCLKENKLMPKPIENNYEIY
jgi:hypothetical protein